MHDLGVKSNLARAAHHIQAHEFVALQTRVTDESKSGLADVVHFNIDITLRPTNACRERRSENACTRLRFDEARRTLNRKQETTTDIRFGGEAEVQTESDPMDFCEELVPLLKAFAFIEADHDLQRRHIHNPS